MMLRRTFAVSAVLLLSVSWACGLDAVGDRTLDTDTGSSDASVISDAKAPPDHDGNVPPDDDDQDAAPPPPECETKGTTCSAPLTKAGWTPVVVPQASAACPDGYQSADLVTKPKAQSGACSCGAPQVTEPSCATNINYTGDVGASCDGTLTKGSTYIVTGDTCMPFNGGGNNLSAVGKYVPIPKSGNGVCSVETIEDPSRLTTTPLRVCTPPAACIEHTCGSDDTASAKICVAHDGDASCPDGFPQKVAAASSATLECGECSCAITGECGAAVLRYYSDALCKQESASRIVDGACHLLTGSATAPVAFRYDANPAFGTIISSGSVATNLDPQTRQTICCR